MVDTEHFYKQYKEATNSYAKWNQDNKFGISNYMKLTTIKPYSLIEITKTKWEQSFW